MEEEGPGRNGPLHSSQAQKVQSGKHLLLMNLLGENAGSALGMRVRNRVDRLYLQDHPLMSEDCVRRRMEVLRAWNEATSAVAERMRQLHLQPSDGVIQCVGEIYMAKMGILDGDDVRVIAGSTGYALGQLWRSSKMQKARREWDEKLGVNHGPRSLIHDGGV